jgi:hypothetical protein
LLSQRTLARFYHRRQWQPPCHYYSGRPAFLSPSPLLNWAVQIRSSGPKQPIPHQLANFLKSPPSFR